MGWVHDVDSLLEAIDQRVPAGSEVYILSERGIRWRQVPMPLLASRRLWTRTLQILLIPCIPVLSLLLLSLLPS